MNVVSKIKPLVTEAIKDLYGFELPEKDLTINITKPEFEGDYTIVLFSFVKQLKKAPEQLGQELGKALVEKNASLFKSYNVIKGFLNLVIDDSYWLRFLHQNFADASFGSQPANGQRVIVEYSSPNTNKPLHLGHLRNNFLGWSVAEILKRSGYTVFKTAILNDRGIHICKSMLAWKLYANGATPDSTGIKGDHFVGDYYVQFGQELKKEAAPILKAIYEGDFSLLNAGETEKATKALQLIAELNAKLAASPKKDEAKKIEENIDKLKEEIKDIAENKTPVMQATVKMLQDWENGDEEVRALWQKMNGWVYEGFNETYKKIGSDFDKNYFESNTYLLGKQFVEEGLQQGVFFKKDDGSVWIDLTAEGLDEKLVLRKDGTSVYITQDLGLADEKYAEYKYDQSIYVIADEQDYHMKVLKLILQKLGKPYAGGIHHLSYGLVELPTGRMKTREGTVVDADDIIEELKSVARQKTEELGKVKDFNPGELNDLHDTIALGALKFFLLRVDPKKRMVFNPEESIELHGFTGPFVQYTYARSKSILRKEMAKKDGNTSTGNGLLKLEKDLVVLLEQYPAIIDQAVTEHDPSVLAVYAFNVAKLANSFYTEHKVLTAETEEKKQLRLQLCEMIANTISSAMHLLGIRVPERM